MCSGQKQSHGDLLICGKIKDTQRSEMAILGNYGSQSGFGICGFISPVFLPYPPPPTWHGGIFSPTDLFLGVASIPTSPPRPKPLLCPKNNHPGPKLIGITMQIYFPLLENTLNPQMPSANIQMHWGCKYFYLQIQFTSLHGLELRLPLIHHHHHTIYIFTGPFLIQLLVPTQF